MVGAGLAGLSAAWWLARRHDVVLVERQPAPGFTAQSVAVPDAQGQTQRVDVPLRVFYPGYYPTLGRLYDALEVASEPVSYAATFTDAGGRPYFRYRNLRWGDRSLGTWAPADAALGAQAWRIVWGMWRFVRAVRGLRGSGTDAGLAQTSIDAFARGHRLPRDFVEGFLLPAICTVCTCSTEQARAFPAAVVIDYLQRGLTREAVRRAVHGADGVQQRLLAGIPALQLNARLQQVRRRRDGVRLVFEDSGEQDFDHVVLATQANHALQLLGAQARIDEAQVLASFTYVPVPVVTHRDAALMPTRRRDWSPVNLWVNPACDAPESTIWINAVQPALRGAADVFQTVHPQREPRESLVVGRARFERPLVGPATATALGTLERLQAEPDRRIWFCGSWAQPGIPLLESAVRSAAHVAERLGAET